MDKISGFEPEDGSSILSGGTKNTRFNIEYFFKRESNWEREKTGVFSC